MIIQEQAHIKLPMVIMFGVTKLNSIKIKRLNKLGVFLYSKIRKG